LQPVNAREKGVIEMRNRKQQGQIIRIGDRWYVRYWERRNIGGTIERKRVTHSTGEVTTRGKRPPADIKTEAERHMATVNSGTGVPDMVIQRILRHANVSTTATYYIKTAAVDVRNAMTKLENHIAEADRIQSDTNGTLDSQSNVEPSTIQ
jgi:hypothetical protein